ncbi:MAG: transposase [Planctomycetaceae bacterium]
MVDFQELDDGEVLCWPKELQDKQLPLRLRFVRVTIGNADVYLPTSVLSAKQLSTEAMASLYKMRWGIEIEFQGLKQTLNGDTLRCRNVDRLYNELHWSLLSIAVAELLAVTEQLASRTKDYTPARRSLASTMKAVSDCLDDLGHASPSGADLFTRLAKATTDNYCRTS